MHTITRSSVVFLWLCTLTFVKSQECTREQFINSPLYDLNFDTTEMEPSYAAGRQIRVGCNVGYSGFFKLVCVSGKWEHKGTKCQPRSCGHPGEAQFADFHLEKGDDFVFGSQVVYTCHKGYQMVSRRNSRTCMAEGWNGAVPVCEAQQCPVIHVDINVQVIGDPEEATFGNVVRFSCKSSSEILIGLTEVYCDEDGQWNGEAPKCKEIKCEVPVIDNGYVIGDIKEYKEHEVLQFKCNTKYKPTEDRSSKCTKMGIRSIWSPTPACEPIKCKLELAQGITYNPAYRNVFLPGERVTITCKNEQWISTPLDTTAETVCSAEGEWSIDPTCKEVTCLRPRDQFLSSWYGGWGQKRLDDTVDYWCQSGFKKTGGATKATCTRSGWHPDPLCQEITCNKKDIENTEILNSKEIYKYGEQVTYICKNGYKGTFYLQCERDGWYGRQQCTEITCNRRYVQHTDILNDKPTYKYGETANYLCKNGYKGNFTLSCGEKGWKGQEDCTEITCNRHDDPDAGIERNAQSTYRYKDKVEYLCKNGYGRYFLTCEETGWTGSPQCTGCPKNAVTHGFIVGPYNDTSTMYTYACDEGYKLLSKGWWSEASCNGSVWSGLQQCVETTNCGPPVIPNAKLTPELTSYQNEDRIQITCNQGYNSEVRYLTCRLGKWDFQSVQPKSICKPVAKHCNPPSKVYNAVVTTSYQKEYVSGSEVTYQCREHYTLEEEGTIRCQDGKWEKKNIKCKRQQNSSSTPHNLED